MPQPNKNRRHILKYGMGTLGALGIFGAGVSTARPSQTKVTDKFDGLKSLYSQHSQKALANAEGINTLSPAPDPEVRALRRLTFGYRPEDREYFDSLGASFDERLENYVDEQLNGYQPGYPPINDPQLTSILNDPLTAWETLDDSIETQWQERTLSTDNAINSHLPRLETEVLAILNAVYGRWQLAEILADFWHTHFSINGGLHETASTFVQYDRDIIRPNILGNFRQMLGAVTKSTAIITPLIVKSPHQITSEGWVPE